jgi:hypothetical protein
VIEAIMQDTLLIELFTEELPPKALPNLAASLTESLRTELIQRGLMAADAHIETFAHAGWPSACSPCVRYSPIRRLSVVARP